MCDKIIYFNNLVTGPLEMRFWGRVANALRNHGIEFCMSAPWNFRTQSNINVAPNARELGKRLYHDELEPSLDDVAIIKQVKKAVDFWKLYPWSDRHIFEYLLGYQAHLHLLQPTMILLWSSDTPPSLLLRLLAQRRNIPVMVVERSPWPMLINIDENGVLLDTESYRKSIQSKESFQLDHPGNSLACGYIKMLNEQGATWWNQPKNLGVESIRKQFGIEKNQEVLLFAGQVDEDVQNFRYNPYFEGCMDAFRAFCEQIHDNQRYFILGKHHPKCRTSPSEFAKIVGKRGCWTDQVSLHDALAIADRVAGVNSALLFEAMAHRKPTMSLGQTMLSGHDVFYEWTNSCDAECMNNWLAAEPDDMMQRSNRYKAVLDYHLKNHFFYIGDLNADFELAGHHKLALILSKSCKNMEKGQLNSIERFRLMTLVRMGIAFESIRESRRYQFLRKIYRYTQKWKF